MSVEEVIEQIYKMNSSKLPGPYGIYPGDLKEIENEIAELLSVVYSLFLKTASVLWKMWKVVIVTVTFKKHLI